MKEAAGEANMTVVTIVLIAAVVAVATPIITSTINGMAKKSCCQSYGGIWSGNKCYSVGDDGNKSAEIALDKYYDSTNKTCLEA